MTDTPFLPARPVDRVRRLVRNGLILAFAVALAVELPQFEAKQECHRGAFSAEFSSAFDISHCDLVIRKTGSEIARVRLPQWWTNQILR